MAVVQQQLIPRPNAEYHPSKPSRFYHIWSSGFVVTSSY